MWMLFFGFLFHRYGLDELMQELGMQERRLSYLDFLAPGVCTMTVLFGASQSGIGWIRDLQTGFLLRMLLCPAAPGAVLLGKILADVVRLLGQALAVLLLGLLLGARLHPLLPALPLALLAVALFAAALASLSCTIALRTQAQEAMAAFVHVINMPLLFTSTVLVPHKQMPDWLAAVSRWTPLTVTVDAWRGALLLGKMPSLLAILSLAVLALLLFLAALSAIKGMVRA
jgi:ABC-2 type transport system permease protein